MVDVNNYPITGAPIKHQAPNGAVPLRIEINELKKNKDAWNLYLLGLQSFYAVDQRDDLSYYEVAGIHGRPNREWGGVKGKAHEQAPPKSRWGGYCTHTSILFASWHRPYLALLEQVLYDHIQKIAASYPAESRARYQKAALNFRIPFWDWARIPPPGETNLPTFIASEKKVKVITPNSNGNEVEIDNPLYSYKFHPVNPRPGDFYDEWAETIRHPNPNAEDPKAVSDEGELIKALANEYQSLRGLVVMLLNDPNYKDYAAFTNHKWDAREDGKGDTGKYASIEDLHNSVHGMVGGDQGHMSELDYASFDPSFWLHHANIDRIFAIWQNINPNSYDINKPAGDGTYVNESTDQYTNSTPLTPFYDSTGQKYWTSDGVWDTTALGYAYPETQSWSFENYDEYVTDIRTKIQQLYGGSIRDLLAAQNPKGNIPKISQPQGQTGLVTPVGERPGKEDPITTPPTAGRYRCPEGPLGGRRGTGVSNVISSLTGAGGPFSRGSSWGTGFSNPISGTQNTISKAKDALIGRRGEKQYVCNVKALKHTLNQTFRVHIFLGEFNRTQVHDWHSDPALAGTIVIFGKDPEETGCHKCVRDATDDVAITGAVPLTNALLEVYQSENNTTLRSLRKEDTLPWLTTNMHWRVTCGDGSERSRDEVMGLKVSVVTTKVSCPEGSFPIYSGDYEIYPQCTQGRPGGYCDGDLV
ncbi:hypothetical protein B0O99DRAFT_656959 [Bisporella sp. PMI_857]|nr:hypothetical protein B0O99DRAFT_656959 [Bisporella sp. PMI_857]